MGPAAVLLSRIQHPFAGRAGRSASSDSTALFWLRAGVLLAVLVPWILFAGVALYTHATALQSAERRMERLAGLAHEHALKLFETTDLLIRQVDLMAAPPVERAALGPQLQALTRGLSQVHSVWLLDAAGASVASSRPLRPGSAPQFADLPQLAAHRERAGQVLLAPPRVGRVTGEVFFDLSRRRDGAAGRFDGITLVGLYPTYFTKFYRDLADSEQDVSLALVHPDGHVVARWPATAEPGSRLAGDSALLGPMRRGLARGQLRAAAEGELLLGAFRQVGSYPAYVVAEIGESAALAGWRRDMALLAAFILPLSVCLALISWKALRSGRQHIHAARALQEEAAERQRVEAALRQSQKLEAMGHLTGGVAHDFNNLLMVVNLNATLLRQRLRDDAHERQLDAIERAVAAGKKLTRQLLAFSRKQPLLPRVLDFAEQMPALLDLIRPALGSRIELSGAVAPGTRRVRLDSAELELALINLSVNARDAMPEGGQVRVQVRDAGSGVELAFSDTGVGIDAKDMERVFEPFFTTKPVGVGTGLGLSQVYGLCARAGGCARVESQRGAGTTVVLSFPAVEAGAEAAAASEQLPAARLEPLALRVLLVEDNLDIASATREILEAALCDVEHVPQPDVALRMLARDAEFDVVLSDIVMPGGMDGIDLCAQLRRSHPQLPVVLMTGYAEKLGEAEAQGLVVLPKPFEPALLLRTLREQMQAGTRVLDEADDA